jgi:hypothetical protein
MDDNYADPFPYPSRTVDEIITQLSHFSGEQRSLAWSPEPPFESVGAHDCRAGGNCGLDFNRETARARWIQARHLWNREQRKLQGGLQRYRGRHRP